LKSKAMKYSQAYAPPAPIAHVKLRNPETLESISNIPMIMDTGSDITLLPKNLCEQIGVEISQTKFLELEGFNNSTAIAHYTYLEFSFLTKMFRGSFLTDDREVGIIGRDILNKFSILFDGKNLEWKEIL
jgi:hypothetical protein